MNDIINSLVNNLALDIENPIWRTNPITEEDINKLYEHNEYTTEYKRDSIVKKLLKLGYPCKSVDEFNYMMPDSCVDFTYKQLKCK